MVYDKVLNNSFTNPLAFNMTGCKRLYMIEAEGVTSYSFEGRMVKNIQFTGVFSTFENLNAITFAAKTEQGRNGTVYVLDITFQLGGLRADANYMLEELINSEVTVIVEDMNGSFWLAGFQQGFISEYEAKTDDGSYLVKMTTRQLTKPEQVSPVTMANLYLAPEDDGSTPPPVITVPIGGGNSGGGNGSGTGNFLVTVVNQNDSTLTDTDEFVLLPAAMNVFLPASSVEGKRYIVKTDYDASVTPSTITVTAGDIDGFTQYALNADRAAVMVIYDGVGTWHTVAFML